MAEGGGGAGDGGGALPPGGPGRAGGAVRGGGGGAEEGGLRTGSHPGRRGGPPAPSSAPFFCPVSAPAQGLLSHLRPEEAPWQEMEPTWGGGGGAGWLDGKRKR